MRSKLFVPAIRFDLFEKALASGADAVCFDLEDAVALNRKATARDYLTPFLRGCAVSSTRLMVRTNTVSSTDFSLDLEACVWPFVFAITLPKVESSSDVAAAEEALMELESTRRIGVPLGILPTIESPRGLRQALEIANASSRVIGLQIGFADLLEPLGIAHGNTFARNQVRLTVRLAAAEAELDCYDSAFPDYKDLVAYQRYLDASREFGFAGCSCIHPAQVEPANLAFTPSVEELAYAKRIVDAAHEAVVRGDAVTSVDGKMIDHPFIVAAARLLTRHRPSTD